MDDFPEHKYQDVESNLAVMRERLGIKLPAPAKLAQTDALDYESLQMPSKFSIDTNDFSGHATKQLHITDAMVADKASAK